MENYEAIVNEVGAWAIYAGQRAVAIKISEEAQRLGDMHGLMMVSDEFGNADEKAIYNNRQQIFRWLRSESKSSRQKIEALLPAIKASLPAESRAKLNGDSLHYRVSIANRRCTEAINSVLLGCNMCCQSISDAITALTALSVIAQQII